MPSAQSLARLSQGSLLRPSVTFAFTGQNAAAGPDGGCGGRGAPAPPPGGTIAPQGSCGWMGSWAGRGCTVTLCLLPAEHPGCHGDHLAAAGPGRAVEGRGWGCAPSHGRLSCPAGHLRLCQGLGAGAAGEGPGHLRPPRNTGARRAPCLLSPCLSLNHSLTSPARPPHRRGVTDQYCIQQEWGGSAVNPEAVKELGGRCGMGRGLACSPSAALPASRWRPLQVSAACSIPTVAPRGQLAGGPGCRHDQQRGCGCSHDPV